MHMLCLRLQQTIKRDEKMEQRARYQRKNTQGPVQEGISTKLETHGDTSAVDLSQASHNNVMQQGRKDQHLNNSVVTLRF
jgi:hypothetical protein